MLLAKVLGSAAGGGYPQWNCRCAVCLSAWNNPHLSQTQSSIAFTGDTQSWFLANASPDIRQQILATPALHPLPGRQSPIKGVFLTNADLDHLLGLLILREETPWRLFATQTILDLIAQNAMFAVLSSDWIERIAVSLTQPIELSSLQVRAFAVPGKVPLYLEASIGSTQAEHTLGLQITDLTTQKNLVYIPGCADLTESLLGIIEAADCLLFDGTMWHDAELIERTGRKKTGKSMAHLPISGKEGSMHLLSFFKKPKFYIHINNTNPIHLKSSKERFEVEQQGWQIAKDGMEIKL